MEEVNLLEVEKRIGYWQHALSKIENAMLKLHSERMDMKERLMHLHRLQRQADLTV